MSSDRNHRNGHGGSDLGVAMMTELQGMPQEYPPMTPMESLGYILRISMVFSYGKEIRRISHEIDKRIGKREGKPDDRVEIYVREALPCVMLNGREVKELNSIKRGLIQQKTQDREEAIAAAKKERDVRTGQMEELKDWNMNKLEKSKMKIKPVSLKKWLVSIGISGATVAAMQAEIIRFIGERYQQLQDLKVATYVAAVSLGVGMVLGIRKFVNWRIEKKQEKTLRQFYGDQNSEIALFEKKKGEAEEKFRSEKERIREDYSVKVSDYAGLTYAKVYQLCERHYPVYISNDANYTQYIGVRDSKGDEEAFNYLVEVGRKEASNQLKNHSPLKVTRFSTENTGGSPSIDRAA